MNEVVEQRNQAAYQHSNGEPIGLSAVVFASRTVDLGMFSMTESQDQSNTAFGSGGVAGSDDLSGLQSGSPEVELMHPSSVEAATSWCCPSGNLGGFSNDSESVLGDEVIGFEPADLDGAEGIVDFDALVGVNQLGSDYENPEQAQDGQSVGKADQAISGLTNYKERSCCAATNQSNDSKINPVTSGSENVIVRHVPKTIAVKQVNSKDLDTQKGI